jgi:hypothetical protein
MRFLVSLLLVAAPLSSHAAELSATQAVRGYFEALNRQDFGQALALTCGEAQARTSHMVDKLKAEAAAHHARVEVRVRALDVREPGIVEPGRGVPVPVAFRIDVVGHKWCFSKVRKLDGEARFWIDPERPDRILAIDGHLAD